jgi:hypothetical protein
MSHLFRSFLVHFRGSLWKVGLPQRSNELTLDIGWQVCPFYALNYMFMYLITQLQLFAETH